MSSRARGNYVSCWGSISWRELSPFRYSLSRNQKSMRTRLLFQSKILWKNAETGTRNTLCLCCVCALDGTGCMHFFTFPPPEQTLKGDRPWSTRTARPVLHNGSCCTRMKLGDLHTSTFMPHIHVRRRNPCEFMTTFYLVLRTLIRTWR